MGRAGIDVVLMILGAIYVVWIAGDFLGPFTGSLTTLGVPIVAWLRRFPRRPIATPKPLCRPRFVRPAGRYGAVNPVAVGALLLGTVLVWGLVVNTFAAGLSWQGYLLEPLGSVPSSRAPGRTRILVCWMPLLSAFSSRTP